MARIGRQIPHFEMVDISSIEAAFSIDKKYRYQLTMRYNDSLIDSGRNESAAVIMKNPSAADASFADATIRKVETFVYHRFQGVRWLHILNIFAYRGTDPLDLNEAYKEYGALYVIGGENDHVIKSVASASDIVILAWGNNSGIDQVLYTERVYRVKQLLHEVPESRLFCISGKQKTKQPLHGLMWGYDHSVISATDHMNMK